jgi:predicted DNA-binding ribbon-helix-helix protein
MTMSVYPIGGNRNRLKETAGDRMARQRSGFIVAKGGKKVLRGFNIQIGDRRTSVRLSPVVADAVEKSAARECCELGELYTYIDRKKEKGVSMATAIRDFALRYFIEAGTKAGHRKAGHGNLINRPKRRLRRAREQDQEKKAA